MVRPERFELPTCCSGGHIECGINNLQENRRVVSLYQEELPRTPWPQNRSEIQDLQLKKPNGGALTVNRHPFWIDRVAEDSMGAPLRLLFRHNSE